MEKTERLLDLVALLLDAREPVSFAELRELFPEEYGGRRDAAERKLERDKAELLQLGVPIEYLQPSRLDERELGGYRIDRQEFFLPDPKLLPEEAAALYAAGAAALAARDFPFAHDLQHALRKISLAGSGAPQEISLAAAAGSEALLERVFEAPSGKLEARFVDGLIPSVLSLGERVWIRGPRGAREKMVKALEKLDELLRREPDPPPAEAPPPQPAAQQAQPAPLDETRQDRLRRLLLVVPAARRRPRARLSELAQELGLDAEQLRDDIEFLGLVGRPPFSPDDLIDISVDERDRVTVALDQSFSRPPQLTALEALALAAAAEEVAPADPAVMSALGKLTEKLPAPARGLYAQLARRLAAATPPPPGAAKVLAQLRRAAQEHKEIALTYDKEGRGDAQERIFRPQGVIDHGGVWYAIGHDAGRNAERTFRVDRVLSVRETGATFADPGPMDPARFQREQLFFPSGREQNVTLRFSPAAAGWALQRYGSRARQLADGGVDVLIESAGTGYAVQLALSLAGEAEIVAPEHARVALRDEVERALRRTEDGT